MRYKFTSDAKARFWVAEPTAPCEHPSSVYEPTPFWGEFAKESLAGESFELKKLR